MTFQSQGQKEGVACPRAAASRALRIGEKFSAKTTESESPCQEARRAQKKDLLMAEKVPMSVEL